MNTRMDTKEKRLAAREAELVRHEENGRRVIRHQAEDCISILMLEGRRPVLKVFDGTAYKPVIYASYTTQENAEKALSIHLEHRKARLEQKAASRGKHELSDVALTAAMIRKELAHVFPGVSFSVHSKSFSMGNSVTVSWTDGPVRDLVDFIIDKYEYGTFDGMTDCAGIRDIDPSLNCPGAKYVSSQRSLSDARKAVLDQYAVDLFGDTIPDQFIGCGYIKHQYFEQRYPDTWAQEYRDLFQSQQEARAAAALAREEQQRKALEQDEQRRQLHISRYATAEPRKVPANVEVVARVQGVISAYSLDLPKSFEAAMQAFLQDVTANMGDSERKAAEARAENYSQMLLYICPDDPNLTDLRDFITASAETLYQGMTAFNAEVERKQADTRRIDTLVAQREQEQAEARKAAQQVQPLARAQVALAAPETLDMVLMDPSAEALRRLLPAM